MSERPLGDDVDQRLRRVMRELVDLANPAPDLDDLSLHIQLLNEGNEAVRKRKTWMLVPAAAVIVVVIVAVLQFDGSDSVTVATSVESSPATTGVVATTAASVSPSASDDELLALGEAFVDAYISGDDDGIADRSTDGVASNEVRYWMEYNDGVGWMYLSHECNVGEGVTGSALVICDLLAEDETSRALGFETGDRWLLRIVDGRFDSLSLTGIPGHFPGPAYVDLFSWMRANGFTPTSDVCAGLPTDIDTTPFECGAHIAEGARAYAASPDFPDG